MPKNKPSTVPSSKRPQRAAAGGTHIVMTAAEARARAKAEPPMPDFTSAEIEQIAANHPDDPPLTDAQAITGRLANPAPNKVSVTMRVDADLLAAYKATGKGWQSRMHDVLRTGIDARAVSDPLTAIAHAAAVVQQQVVRLRSGASSSRTATRRVRS